MRTQPAKFDDQRAPGNDREGYEAMNGAAHQEAADGSGETAEADEENLGHQQKFRDSVVVISGSERPE